MRKNIFSLFVTKMASLELANRGFWSRIFGNPLGCLLCRQAVT